jgi:alpha-glucosidase
MKRTLRLLSMFLIVHQTYSQTYEIKSPNENIRLTVVVNGGISWSASLNENVIIKEAKIGMDFSSGQDFGTNSQVKAHTLKKFSSMIYPVIPHKDAAIKDEFVQLMLTFKGKYQLKFRAYNDGVAYQFLDNKKSDRNVMEEKMSLTFPKGAKSFFPKEDNMYSHNERLYLNKSLSEISSDEFCSLPVVFTTDNAKVLFTETALHNYPGMFVKGNGNTTMDAIFPKYVLETIDDETHPDRNQTITKEADYIAVVSGKLALGTARLSVGLQVPISILILLTR